MDRSQRTQQSDSGFGRRAGWGNDSCSARERITELPLHAGCPLWQGETVSGFPASYPPSPPLRSQSTLNFTTETRRTRRKQFIFSVPSVSPWLAFFSFFHHNDRQVALRLVAKEVCGG